MSDETNNTANNNNTTVIEYDGEAAAKVAIAFASQEDANTSAAIGKVLQAKEDWQGGPVTVLFALMSNYGEKLAEFPVPDSEGGNNPDKFKMETEVAGKTSKRPTTWYTIFADNTREGKAIKSELALIDGIGKEGYDQSIIPATLKDLSPIQRKNRADYLKGRRGTIRNAYKKAITLGFHMQAVNALPGVVADFIWQEGPDGKPLDFASGNPTIENSTKCISIVTTNVNRITKDWEIMGVANFLRLKPSEAANRGGTYAALMATKKREPGTDNTGNTNGVVNLPPIDTLKVAKDYILNLHGWTDKVFGSKAGADYAALLKNLNGAGSDDLLSSIFGIVENLQTITRMDKLAARYAAMQENQARAV